MRSASRVAWRPATQAAVERFVSTRATWLSAPFASVAPFLRVNPFPPPPPRLLQVPVNRLLDPGVHLHRRLVIERQRLHHHDDADLRVRIDEEVRVEDPGPRAASGRAAVRRLLRGELKAEAPAILAGAEREVPRQARNRRLLRLHDDAARVALEHRLRRLLAQN